jgi:hypothetical protein
VASHTLPSPSRPVDMTGVRVIVTAGGPALVVAQVFEILSTDDRGVESGFGNGKANHELDAAYTFELFVHPGRVPAVT